MQNSHIEWTDHTFNPWIGCTKVSPGCQNCYAEARDERFFGGVHWGKGMSRERTSEGNWKLPLRWNKAVNKRDLQGYKPDEDIMRRPRVFCASLADWLDADIPIEWLADLLSLIHATPNLNWLLLTKRPENFFARCLEATNRRPVDHLAEWYYEWESGKPPGNVWLGTTVEDQKRADERIPKLLEIPAKVRFLSCEPLLGAVDLRQVVNGYDKHGYRNAFEKDIKGEGIDWVIAGTESGANRRPAQIEWAESLAAQCTAAGVAFFAKQFEVNGKVSHDLATFPSTLQRREFPRV